MKNKRNKKRELFDVLNDVKKLYEENNNSIPANEVEQINTLFSEADSIKKRENRDVIMGGITFIVLIAFFVSVFVISRKEIDSLNNDISQKATIINKLQRNNIILSFNLNGTSSPDTDSIKELSVKNDYRPAININGKSLSHNELVKEYDSLSLVSIKQNYKIKEHKYIVEEMQSRIDLLNIQLDIINKKYGISFVDNFPVAPKLDSALHLLPFFRNNMKFDKIKNRWIISK